MCPDVEKGFAVREISAEPGLDFIKFVTLDAPAATGRRFCAVCPLTTPASTGAAA